MAQDSFAQHKQIGNELYRNGKYHDAIREYTKCIEIGDEKLNYLVYANRAMCNLQIGKYEQAETDCTKSIKLSPNYVKGYLRRGAARKALGKFNFALSDFQKALKIQPKNTQARNEVNGIKQILETKKKFKRANTVKSKSKRKTKIRKIEQTVETQIFRQMFENANKLKKEDKNKIFYGQLVVGPPGSGKTTYCNVIQQYMTNVLHRNVAIINLDPNNENMEYHPLINICELINSEDVAENLHLGPNGSLIYCLEYLSENMEWLRTRLNAIRNDDTYLIFDCPGQIELYIHHPFMRKLTQTIVNEWHYRLTCVNLVDVHHCCNDLRTNDCSNFISVMLMATSMMLHLELPHVNVLSKCDLMSHYDESIVMPMEFYTDGQDLGMLVRGMYNNKKDSELLDIEKKFKHLNNALAECINDYGLVNFVMFAINDLNSMKNVCKVVDRGNGYDLMGQYYEQIEMEQKIWNQRRNEMEQDEKESYQNGNDADAQIYDAEHEHNVFGLGNPLLPKVNPK